MSTTDLKIPGAWIYPSSGPRRWLPTPDGHRLPPLRDLIAAHDSTTRKSDFLLNYVQVVAASTYLTAPSKKRGREPWLGKGPAPPF